LVKERWFVRLDLISPRKQSIEFTDLDKESVRALALGFLGAAFCSSDSLSFVAWKEPARGRKGNQPHE